MTEREKQANEILQSIAKDIKEKLPENMGFALLAYEFGDGEDKRLMYISNSNREDVMKAMVEFLEKNVNDPTMFGKDV
jgi:hypothetical protein